jgi:hypothetical protein
MTLEFNKKTSKGTKLLVGAIALMVVGSILWWVTYRIKEHHLMDDPMIRKLKEILDPLHPEIKNVQLYKGKKSYTINKKKIYLCLKDKNDEYYPTNFLIYVFLHEYAHYLNKDDIGHTPKFHEIFENLIEKAHELGIYNSSIPLIEDYCMHNQDSE